MLVAGGQRLRPASSISSTQHLLAATVGARRKKFTLAAGKLGQLGLLLCRRAMSIFAITRDS